MFTIVILIVVCLARSTWAAGCPPAKDLAPLCNCQQYGGDDNLMDCHDVLNANDLYAPMRSLSKHRSEIYSLQFEDSVLTYLPSDLFRGTSIEEIRFYRTEIMSLSDTDVAFVGLEDTLAEIRATEAEFIASWDWQQLRNLRNLDLIDVNQIIMGAVDEPFPRLQNLTALGITNAGIAYLVEGAFADLPSLKILNLESNEIEELKRNMLPDPAENLVILDLSNNQIHHLPEDIFSNMPKIKIVHLSNNQFTTLAENPFRFAFQNLHELCMAGNSLQCDCRMRWLVDHPTPFQLTANCTRPEILNGYPIASLELKQLWC